MNTVAVQAPEGATLVIDHGGRELRLKVEWAEFRQLRGEITSELRTTVRVESPEPCTNTEEET